MVLSWLLTSSHILGLVGFSQCRFWPLPFCVGSDAKASFCQVASLYLKSHMTLFLGTPLALGLSWRTCALVSPGLSDAVPLPKTCACTFLWACSLQEAQWDQLYCKHLQVVKNNPPCAFWMCSLGWGGSVCLCEEQALLPARHCSLQKAEQYSTAK